jgi:hypothetical protein
VDAIRRQHQRDAYAAFLSAANVYAYATDWNHCVTQARQELAEAEGVRSQHYHPGYVAPRAINIRMRAGALLESIRPVLDVVSLEGPADVAELASKVHNAAYELAGAAAREFVMNRDENTNGSANELHLQLMECITEFTITARDYLNGESS